MRRRIDIEGLGLDEWRALSPEDQDALVPFGRALTVSIGSATVLVEFLDREGQLVVNLAQIDGGGEGVLLQFLKLATAWARDRGRPSIRWNVFAATCADPNPRLQAFLRTHGFHEVDDPEHGLIFTRTVPL